MIVLKLIFNYKVFSTKLYVHEMVGSRQKIFADLCAKQRGH